VVRLGVALAIGLLIGLERERRKGRGPGRGPAGIRTFGLAALVGGLSALLPGVAVFVVAGAFIAALAVASYLRSRTADPGLTTEVALVATFLLGGLALRDPALASGVGVVVTVLLASRGWLHRFVRSVLTEDELHDGLVLAAAALVILPLAPDRGFGPLGALNPWKIWLLVVLVMAISGAGHVAVRVLGARAGLPLAGFAGGFVSSTATIGTMGARARKRPALGRAAAAGAVLSTVATVVQLVVVLAATNPAVLRAMTLPLVLAGAAAVAFGAAVAFRVARPSHGRGQGEEEEEAKSHAFDLRAALLFAAIVSVILFVSAQVTVWLGKAGTLGAAALAGFADAHAAAIAVASLAAAGSLAPTEAVLPILAAFTTNTVSKAVVAVTTGDRRFALTTLPGLALVVAGAWAGWLLARASAPA
jgi:uncharacterized membrane protein (DUF4010 family)